MRRRARLAGAEVTEAQRQRVVAYEGGEAARFGWHVLRHTFCSHPAMTAYPPEDQAAGAIDALDGRTPARLLQIVT
jgi:hypothetical protein